MAQVASQRSMGLVAGGGEQSVRVEDYLNDQLQTEADLENLDSLLENVQKQQKLLKDQVGRQHEFPTNHIANEPDQLREAEFTLDRSTSVHNSHRKKLLKDAEAFQKQQVDIDRRLRILAQSDTSDDAIVKFESSMQRLQRLDVAKGYFTLLVEAQNLR